MDNGMHFGFASIAIIIMTVTITDLVRYIGEEITIIPGLLIMADTKKIATIRMKDDVQGTITDMNKSRAEKPRTLSSCLYSPFWGLQSFVVSPWPPFPQYFSEAMPQKSGGHAPFGQGATCWRLADLDIPWRSEKLR
jgi:hypothetical protein